MAVTFTTRLARGQSHLTALDLDVAEHHPCCLPHHHIPPGPDLHRLTMTHAAVKLLHAQSIAS